MRSSIFVFMIVLIGATGCAKQYRYSIHENDLHHEIVTGVETFSRLEVRTEAYPWTWHTYVTGCYWLIDGIGDIDVFRVAKRCDWYILERGLLEALGKKVEPRVDPWPLDYSIEYHRRLTIVSYDPVVVIVSEQKDLPVLDEWAAIFYWPNKARVGNKCIDVGYGFAYGSRIRYWGGDVFWFSPDLDSGLRRLYFDEESVAAIGVDWGKLKITKGKEFLTVEGLNREDL
ncbi:hypothetical protein KS4_00080 [Poriferisphaera corsica]|uniref:Uncharacterized protein n=1 Tax=Poriferisphaera corsica TaxID=2528020 RepID=A0A517YP35_9BACT|nr:hypothetical protein [Poriferisphaera corsica]QDU31980.1 hypothetical protein KS4_00080 [Poriferisphaera corsica]